MMQGIVSYKVLLNNCDLLLPKIHNSMCMKELLRIKAQWHMKVRQKVLKANTYLVKLGISCITQRLKGV